MSASDAENLPGSSYARSFGSEAARYVAARPGYAGEAIDHALRGIRTAVASLVGTSSGDRASRILDLGAGTGKLTASLIGRADEIVAVEPDAEMLAELRHLVPQATALEGSAERIPLPDQSVDAILVGQAFHWFGRPQADREFARVLRPGGTVGLIWNFPDQSVEWIPKLYLATKREPVPWSAVFDELDQSLFTAAEETWFATVHRLDGPAALSDLVHTWSWVITMPAPERAAIKERLRVLVARYAELQGPTVLMPQRTKVVRQVLRS